MNIKSNLHKSPLPFHQNTPGFQKQIRTPETYTLHHPHPTGNDSKHGITESPVRILLSSTQMEAWLKDIEINCLLGD